MTGSMASASKVFDTATRVTLAGSRDASRQARSISCRTAARPVPVVWRAHGSIHNTAPARAKSTKPGAAGFVTSGCESPQAAVFHCAWTSLLDLLRWTCWSTWSTQSSRDQMVLAAGFRIALRQLDVAGTFQVIHGADVLAVGTQDFHVFLDVAFLNMLRLHSVLKINGYGGAQFQNSAIHRAGGNRRRLASAVSWSGGCGPGRR